MSLRSEIESRLASFAAAQTPPIPISLENRKFSKPSEGYYLSVVFLDSTPISNNLSASGVRLYGLFQISCYGPLGVGTGEIEDLAQKIVDIYPVIPKVGTVSIEKPLSIAQGFPMDNFFCVPITGKYRVEQ